MQLAIDRQLCNIVRKVPAIVDICEDIFFCYFFFIQRKKDLDRLTVRNSHNVLSTANKCQ